MIDSAFCNPCPTRGIQNIDMAQKLNVERMRVATPCHVGWDSMAGDDRARFCSNCKRHVYNIVGLSRGEIESLVQTTEGRLCVRMYQRADAAVLTRDCPVGLRAVRKRIATFAGVAFSALLGLVSVGYGQKSESVAESNIKIERTKIDSTLGEISGSVNDRSGAVIPDIIVVLKSDRFEERTKTDGMGKFRFDKLRTDTRFELSLERDDFIRTVITELNPAGGEILNVSVRMEGRTSQPYAPVEQELSPATIEPTSLSTVLSSQSTECLPNVERIKTSAKKGQISGTLMDPFGAVVPGTEIKLELEKRLVTKTRSDAAGNFKIPDINPADEYTLSLSGQMGFKNLTIQGIAIHPGEKLSYSICLEVAVVGEVVGLYAAEPDVLSAEPTEPTDTFSPREIFHLPITTKTFSKPPSAPQQPEKKRSSSRVVSLDNQHLLF